MRVLQGILLLSLTVLLAAAGARDCGAQELRRIPYRSSLDGKERDFFLYLPRGFAEGRTRTWPVIFFLHGDGERGDGKGDLDFVLVHGPIYEAWIQKRDLPFVIVAPQLHMLGRDGPGGPTYLVNRTRAGIPARREIGVPDRPRGPPAQGPMNGAVASTSLPFAFFPPRDGWERVETDLMGILRTVLSGFPCDPGKVYLTGLSAGGAGVWYLASRHPEVFAAISPISAWAHPDLMGPLARANTPVWAFSGGMDTIVETRCFFAGLNALVAAGDTNVRFTTHQDMAHEVWTRVYSGQDIYDWFLSFTRR